jgi:uncharacterized membrane protein
MRPAPNVAWNLFLAVIPVVLAFAIARGARRDMQGGRIRWGLWLPLGLVWLAFLPNSCYLLTEWRHYLETLTQSALFTQARQSRDGRLDFFVVTAFYLIYSGVGLLAFFLALWPLDRLTRRRLGWAGAALRPLIFPLCALGVYLGLMSGRFNSWDLVHPHRLAGLLATTGAALHRPALLGLVLAFGAILWLFYAAFDIWMDGLAWRLAHRRARRRHPENQHLEDAHEKDSTHAPA